MSLCASCGLALSGLDAERGVCSHHHTIYADEWAVNNRIVCDGLHRGKWPARLPPSDREEYSYEGVA